MTMPIPDGSVVITPRQMYDQIGELAQAVRGVSEDVRAVKSAVDPAIAEVRSDIVEVKSRTAAAEGEQTRLATRVTILETKIRVAWALFGAVLIALGVVAGFLSHYGH